MSLIDRLTELISFDTQNPTGDERPLLRLLATQLTALGATAVAVQEVRERQGYVYACFGAGQPALLLNAHVDHGARQYRVLGAAAPAGPARWAPVRSGNGRHQGRHRGESWKRWPPPAPVIARRARRWACCSRATRSAAGRA